MASVTEFSGDVVVLRVGTFREADCWVRFFSPQHGLLTGFAFGGRKSTRRFCGCLDPFSVVHFRVGLDRLRRYHCLEEGTLLRGFPGLKRNIKNLGMMANCVRFFESQLFDPEEYAPSYALLVETLEALENAAAPSSFLPLLFRARLTFCQGYQPDFDRCRGCGQSMDPHHRAVFAVHEGGIYCLRCASSAVRTLSISQATLRLLGALGQSNPAEWARWNLPAHVREECARVVDAFVHYHLGLRSEGHGFYRC